MTARGQASIGNPDNSHCPNNTFGENLGFEDLRSRGHSFLTLESVERLERFERERTLPPTALNILRFPQHAVVFVVGF